MEQQKRKSSIAPFSLMLRRIILLLVRRNFKILLETRYLCDKSTRDANFETLSGQLFRKRL